NPNGKVAVYDGTGWTASNGGNPVAAGIAGIASLAVFNGKLYAGTSSGGKVVSFDGAAWTPTNGNNPIISGENVVPSLAAFNGKLYAGTNPGVKVGEFTAVPATLTGTDGSPLPQTLGAPALTLAFSTNSQTCGGLMPCGATNQIRFAVA